MHRRQVQPDWPGVDQCSEGDTIDHLQTKAFRNTTPSQDSRQGGVSPLACGTLDIQWSAQAKPINNHRLGLEGTEAYVDSPLRCHFNEGKNLLFAQNGTNTLALAMPITRSQKALSRRARSSFNQPAKESLEAIRLGRKLHRMARLSTKAIFLQADLLVFLNLEHLSGGRLDILWDGRTPLPIVDRKTNKIIGVLAGQPSEPGWPETCSLLADLLESERHNLSSPKYPESEASSGGRGAFVAKQTGYSHGGGRTEPGPFDNAKPDRDALARITQDAGFHRLAGFMSLAFKKWSPKIYHYYRTCMALLEQHDPSLRRPFLGSVYPAATFNFGPRTTCVPHIDHANLPFGWCAISSLGTFDPAQGGHLVLKELRLVIEFPPGSVILIPSAVVTHGNTPVSSDEKRYSFTQYAAGGLFRWVEHGFQTDTSLLASLTRHEAKKLKDSWAQYGQEGFNMLRSWVA
ncbi:hypothetical protein BKA70DRAFT_1239023 [Coprinopsis sp. MPI-PUGE-AT-0042]|nr:hypothetical protein BKA70DRAFT_1239023 [Coprinopsis sp. MPI-PUGE-AT-0042]